MTIVIILAIIAIAAFIYMQSKKDKHAALIPNTIYFPCILEGNVNMPDHDERIIARNKELIANGHGVSGDEARDNAIGGGGAPDGGMWLSGSYHFEIDANGQRIDDKSWIKLYSDDKYQVTGGITGAGVIAMGSIGGVQISGSVVGGKPVGKVMHGSGKVHIYGLMDGVWSAV